VLSDGDRSTLALAMFVLSIERAPDLGEAIVVFDDPMTSQDAQRSEATAEQITRLAKRADQVIVVSHLAPFLLQVAYDWRRHGGEAKSLAELELDRTAMTLRPWAAENHATDEHARRAAELRTFSTDPASDAFAPRMHGEIRKLVEHRLRETRPQLYAHGSITLEALVRRLRADAELLAAVKWTADDLEELDRLTAFTARAGMTTAPEPEVVRSMARRALAFVER
jgi:wobble nucleotide-excising tRNase